MAPLGYGVNFEFGRVGGGGGGGGGGAISSPGNLGMPRAFGAAPFSGVNAADLHLQGFVNPLDAACTFSTYTISFNGTSNPAAGCKLTPCLFADNAGNPDGGARIAVGTEVTFTGTETGDQTYAFGSTQTLAAGTKYWFGFITSSAGSWPIMEGSGAGTYAEPTWRKAANTYASGVPATCPTTSDTGQLLGIQLNVTAARGVQGIWDITHGPTDNSAGANEMDLQKVVLPAGGPYNVSAVVLRLSYIVTNGSKIKAVIYTDSSGAPGTLVAVGSELTLASPADQLQRKASLFSGVSLGAGTYWIGFTTDSSNRMICGRSGSGQGKWENITYASPPSSAGAMAELSRQLGTYILFS